MCLSLDVEQAPPPARKRASSTMVDRAFKAKAKPQMYLQQDKSWDQGFREIIARTRRIGVKFMFFVHLHLDFLTSCVVL